MAAASVANPIDYHWTRSFQKNVPPIIFIRYRLLFEILSLINREDYFLSFHKFAFKVESFRVRI